MLLLVQLLNRVLLISVIDPILSHPLESYNYQKLLTTLRDLPMVRRAAGNASWRSDVKHSHVP